MLGNDNEKRKYKMLQKVQFLRNYEIRFMKFCLRIKWYQEVKEEVVVKGCESNRRMAAACGKFRWLKGLITGMRCSLKKLSNRKRKEILLLGSRSKKGKCFRL